MKRFIQVLLMTLVIIFVALASYYVGASYPNSKLFSNIERVITGKEVTESEGVDPNKVEKKLDTIKKILDTRFLYDVDEKMLEEGIYKGYVSSANDIYTQYYTKEEFKALNEQNQGSFGGVGIEVNGSKGQYIEVVAPIKGTPADRAGIKSGDKIIAIDGKEYLASELEAAVKVMRGEPGNKVTLTVLRQSDGKEEKLDIELVREIINVESIHAKLLEGGIAYINITNFQGNTDEQFFKALKDLKKQGANKLILDLRNNPGGLLDVTLKIADYLLPEGAIMNVSYKDGTKQNYPSDKEKDSIPMVTLINGGSASASEVLSGALRDFERSEIIGEKSFGKGVVQEILDLPDGSGVKVTISEFFTPKGNKIHGVGISPTKEVKLDEKATSIGPESLDQDNQLREAIEILKK